MAQQVDLWPKTEYDGNKSRDQSPKLENEALGIGSLMYAIVCTSPDIAHAIKVGSCPIDILNRGIKLKN